MTTTNKPMTGEQLDELMTVAVNMQRDSEKGGERPAAMFAYAVQVAVLELRKVRDDAAALAAENSALKEWSPNPHSTSMWEAIEKAESLMDDGMPELAMVEAFEILKMKQTPSTDAFLTEVRAQGVEQLASLAGDECQRYKSVNDRAGVRKWKSIVILCSNFAAQLRKGAAQ